MWGKISISIFHFSLILFFTIIRSASVFFLHHRPLICPPEAKNEDNSYVRVIWYTLTLRLNKVEGDDRTCGIRVWRAQPADITCLSAGSPTVTSGPRVQLHPRHQNPPHDNKTSSNYYLIAGLECINSSKQWRMRNKYRYIILLHRYWSWKSTLIWSESLLSAHYDLSAFDVLDI